MCDDSGGLTRHTGLLIQPVREHMDDDKQFKLSLLREPRNAERSEIL